MRSGTVAVCAPGGRDAAVIEAILRTAGVDSASVGWPDLLDGVASAAFAAAVIAEEAMVGSSPAAVTEAIARQPPWSDFPCVVLTRRNRHNPSSPIVLALNNVTEVERPVHPATLLGTVRSALRARARQHETADHLRARAAAEADLKALAQTLEAKVAERTATLQATNATLEREMAQRLEAELRLRTVQGQLIHVSRLNAMNTMGSAIAHELNQPLAAILNYMRGAERLLGRVPDVPADLLDAVRAAAGNAHRAGLVIRRLRDLIRHQPVARRPGSLALMAEEARALALINSPLHAVECRIDIAAAADRVIVDAVQIQQVLINLIRNAADAMEHSPERVITVAARHISAGRVQVTVTDTGPGVPADFVIEQVAPFRSSKPEGLGIGLSICRTIIEDHGGKLRVANAVAGGAVVSFDLPGRESEEHSPV